MNEPPQEFIEKAWNTLAENYGTRALKETATWTPHDLYALFETAVRIGYDWACPERDRVRY